MSEIYRKLDCWLDERSGLPCLMLLGQWGEGLGYVGVTPGHPYYNIDNERLNLKAYGGVSFTREVFRSEEESPFSHLFSVYSGDSLYLFGFHCWQPGDFVPGFPVPGTKVRDDEFVRQECIFLADQLARAASSR